MVTAPTDSQPSQSLLIIKRVSFWLLKFSPFYLKTLISYLILSIHLPSVQISLGTPGAWSVCVRARLCLCCIICSITHLLLFLVSYCSGAGARRNERTNPFPCNSSAQSLCCSCSHAQLKTDTMLSTGSRSFSVMDQPSKCRLCSTGAVGCFDGFFGGLDRHLPLKSPC